ncbi:hypothetical protein NJF44_24690 [Pseudomonas guariconensis]|nr:MULTISPECIES: hypothetical protein [Pseudomonas]MCO7640205.1 hypothetical protein [Pseudomonas sp. S 311-6]MCO7515936.1 hypothetical protein [Pseudomonas putida]MCO7565603.1 hypothetical protein [Pseudomonas mosselii]MCO7593262.1 hypothetical protein [Pseudomonas guariconensis]MCO7608431.1 hypothetical protein [Pseudomonas guariconensis]
MAFHSRCDESSQDRGLLFTALMFPFTTWENTERHQIVQATADSKG